MPAPISVSDGGHASNTGGKLLAETGTGNVETALSFGQTYARPAGVEHNIVNPNVGEFRFIEIELK
jgi:mannose-6-phosphate isomerase-like protein (cupin superfamily)